MYWGVVYRSAQHLVEAVPLDMRGNPRAPQCSYRHSQDSKDRRFRSARCPVAVSAMAILGRGCSFDRSDVSAQPWLLELVMASLVRLCGGRAEEQAQERKDMPQVN